MQPQNLNYDLSLFSPTEEDRKRAMAAALQNFGLGLLANANRAPNEALAAGFGGGLQGYQQGMQAPMGRFEQMKMLEDFQGKRLSNQKTRSELDQTANLQGLLGGIASAQADPFSLGLGPVPMDDPRVGQGTRQMQAQLWQDPAVMAQLAANGMKGSDYAAYAGRFDPREIKAGTYQQDPLTGRTNYMTQLPQGMNFDANGRAVNAPGFTDSMYAQEQSKQMAGVLPDQLKTAFSLSNAPVTDVTTGRIERAGTRNPVIGLPPQYGGAPQGQPQQGAQVALTPAQQITGANLTKGNDVWREKTLIPVVEAAGPARESLSQLQALRQLDLTTGFGTDAMAALASPFARLGYAPAKEYKSAVDMARSIIGDQTLTKQMIQRGIATDKDTALVKTTLYSLGNTPAANQFVIDFAEATARQTAAKAQFYEAAHNRALERGITNLSQIDSAWRQISRPLWDDPAMKKWLKK